MSMALLWGALSGSAVFLGALAALYLKIPVKLTGWIMAFGTGVLMGAAAYELLGDSMEQGGMGPTVLGFSIGAILFTAFDWYISRKGGAGRKRSSKESEKTKKGSAGGGKEGGAAIFVGTVMDAVPESIMIGTSLLSGSVSWLLVVAIFISNIPEGLSSTVGLKAGGYSRGKILLLWLSVLVISALCSLGGYVFLEGAPDELMAVIGSFAGGGITAMVASTMMPEAYEEGGPVVGLLSACGLISSLILDRLSG
ncbi:ZIP family metal transporter [Paenibacillus aurantius]|uniref:ZIP family metal transporter n=1 Tax=Paenibacillus aurantius TaxID=2918900 RepID=A0AA96RDT8_9BACL|nr:ZIP family metal transporter [Paenibacillus aurantius]WNQ09463.1 ZIP family metal transporter [Paenibacillus aurantius]